MIADSTGTTVWRWDQGEPFGNDVPNNDPSGLGAFDFNMRFPGQYFDRETNNLYNAYRDYNPEIGRYVESDPLGLPGGLNTYSYVGSNPIRHIDPYGLTCQTNWDFFTDWWFERGSPNRKYPPGGPENQEMQNSAPADYMRNEFKAGGCQDIGRAGYGTIRAYFETFTAPCSTPFQVGGFVWSAINVGNCNVRYRVYNTASLYSFFFHIPGIPHKSRGGSFPVRWQH